MLDVTKTHSHCLSDSIPVYLFDNVSCDNVREYVLRASPKSEFLGEGSEFIFVPDNENLLRKGVIAAESLVSPLENVIPVQVFVPQGKRKLLYSGTRVGWLENYSTNDSNAKGIFYNTEERKLSKSQFLEQFTPSVEDSDLKSLLINYQDVFSKSKMDLGHTKICHEIDTGETKPIALKARRTPIAVEDEVEKQIGEMLKNGIIKRSESPWSFPIVVVRKKNGDLRICVDYRKLNQVTRRPIFPIPDSQEIFDCIGGAKYFTTLDLSQGYHQIPMNESDKCKTAFATRTGHYQYEVMPFGLCGAPATFQRMMQSVLQNEAWQKCVIYLDDVLIFGKTVAEHNERLRAVLDKFRKGNLKLSPAKCKFLQEKVQYLGHIISEEGIATDTKKVEKIVKWPLATCADELHSFLGLCNYYRKFIHNYSQLTEPLYKAMNRKPFSIKENEAECFSTLKIALSSSPILSLPQKDEKFILDTDASYGCIGAVLSQVQDGQEKVICYASNQLSKAQKKYCVTRKELLAAYSYIIQFKHYLMGKKFILRTDHKALQWLLNWKRPNTSQFCLWKSELEAFDFDIQHRNGVNHGNADALSRYIQCEQCEINHPDPKKKRNVKKFLSSELDVKSIEEEKILNQIEDHSDLFDGQCKDPEISEIIKFLNGEISVAEIKNNSYFGLRKNLRRRGEMLYITNSKNYYQLVVPQALVRDIIAQYHDKLSHLGVNKCLSIIKERYYWPNMDIDISKYIRCCRICMKTKDKNGRQKAPISTVESNLPFQLLCIDIAGPFTPTRNNNRYILGMVDHLSKYAVLIPLKSLDSKTISRAIFKHWLTKFGMPQTILSDNGRYFGSELINELCSVCGIAQKFSPPYHQQSNGLIERLFKTIKPLLSAVVLESGHEWDECLTLVEMSLRVAKQKSTGVSPFEILFAYESTLRYSSDRTSHHGHRKIY